MIYAYGLTLSLQDSLPICNEIGLGHIDHAGDREHVRPAGTVKPCGHIAKGADIGGDILPHLPVAARRRLDEHALFIADGGGKPVDLRLGGQRHFRLFPKVQEAPHAADEILDLLVGKGVVRSEEHTSELQSLMRISYAVFCLKKKNHTRKK